ncbi:MAG: hypothetical protein K2H60_03550 [Muribaculaceae bacterium]|nr:hypothetical protein [Muribaculaceae bacterium]
MAKTKENFLKSICEALYPVGNHKKPDKKLYLESGLYEEICNVYKSLGGLLEVPPFNVGDWDINLEKVIIECDEENHFNRYRLKTLESSIYDSDSNFNIQNYKKYCKGYEKRCRTDGKYGTSSGSEKQFGECDLDGELNSLEHSRWKQRAFYDYLRDVYSKITGVPVIRISIYDDFKFNSVGQLLKDSDTSKTRELVRSRVEEALKSE